MLEEALVQSKYRNCRLVKRLIYNPTMHNIHFSPNNYLQHCSFHTKSHVSIFYPKFQTHTLCDFLLCFFRFYNFQIYMKVTAPLQFFPYHPIPNQLNPLYFEDFHHPNHLLIHEVYLMNLLYILHTDSYERSFRLHASVSFFA